MEHLFDMRPDRPGYRLHRLEVFNWGTFDSSDGNVFRFEPDGRTSLLVGHNGSGKSTLVDAILTLLVDSRTRNYNVAAGAKKTERTPKSYIKGAFDRTSDDSQTSVVKFLRPRGNHLTAISAVFREEQLGTAFTLAQILYLKADGSDDKVFAIADESHELERDLAGLHKSDAVVEHLKQLGYQTTRTYVEYQGWLAKRTRMRSKAVDMFNQTVAVKDIQSLNAFIRKHMLEAHDWRDKVQRLLTHFNDLSVAHQELVRARRAEELLEPVEKVGSEYRRQADEMERRERERDAAETFFPLRLIELFEPEVDRQRQNVAVMTKEIDRLDGQLKETRESVRKLKNDIDRAGGERLKQIPSLIKIEQNELQHKQSALDVYRKNLRACGIETVVDSSERFRHTRERLMQVSESTSARRAMLKKQYEDAIGRRADTQRKLRDERNELEVLEKRRTNLPARFSEMRSRLCSDLNLDEAVVPFAAELISLRADERRWEASAEMVLRSFALSLLVPQRFYPRVRGYVERNRIADAHGGGQRLDYICVGKPTEQTGDRIDPRSLFSKLQFKPRHDLAPWVRGEILRRFAFHCCESVEEFNEVPRLAMTANRHVKFNAESHKKDDRQHTIDPRHFVLGWDNTEKKRRIADRIRELESDRKTLDDNVAVLDLQVQDLENVKRAALAASEVADFGSIDVKRHRDTITALTTEKKQLEDSNDIVKALRKRLAEVDSTEQSQSADRDAELARKATLEAEIQRMRTRLESAGDQVQQSKDSGQFDLHRSLFDAITESMAEPALSLESFDSAERDWRTATGKRIDELTGPLKELSAKLMGAMSKYLREFQEERDDLDASVQSLASFLGTLDQLRREDLPRHEKKFKDRLNDQVSQEVALFNTELRHERRQIEDKVEQLNEALKNVEYSRGTFMRLEPRPVKDREIEEFRRSLRECLDDSLENTDEANEARFLRIQALVERLSDKERTTWRNKVIDVRNWYDFAAREIESESGKTRSSYDGSSGQSGGEKAKLAFTILVAALAYQFDVDPTGHVPGRFQFVVVDEMFSRVDDQNAQYALKLFKQFGLQLLIVAPLDAKARITEPFVDRYLHVVKDPATNQSQIYSMTAQEYEAVVKGLSESGQHEPKPRVSAT